MYSHILEILIDINPGKFFAWHYPKAFCKDLHTVECSQTGHWIIPLFLSILRAKLRKTVASEMEFQPLLGIFIIFSLQCFILFPLGVFQQEYVSLLRMLLWRTGWIENLELHTSQTTKYKVNIHTQTMSQISWPFAILSESSFAWLLPRGSEGQRQQAKWPKSWEIRGCSPVRPVPGHLDAGGAGHH